MSWAQNIQLQVFDPRYIGRNLLDWFKQNQKDALLWASDGAQLPPVLDFFENEHIPTRFPVCMLKRIQYRTPRGDDYSITEIALEFEIWLVHGKLDWLAASAPKYSMAFESMVANFPKTSLEKDSKIVINAVEEIEIETTFDFMRSSKNKFMQIFSTQVNWQCLFVNKPN